MTVFQVYLEYFRWFLLFLSFFYISYNEIRNICYALKALFYKKTILYDLWSLRTNQLVAT